MFISARCSYLMSNTRQTITINKSTGKLLIGIVSSLGNFSMGQHHAFLFQNHVVLTMEMSIDALVQFVNTSNVFLL